MAHILLSPTNVNLQNLAQQITLVRDKVESDPITEEIQEQNNWRGLLNLLTNIQHILQEEHDRPLNIPLKVDPDLLILNDAPARS